MKQSIISTLMEIAMDFSERHEDLVPDAGPAESLAGEIVRAVDRLVWRFLNDGDMCGVDGGRDTCGSAARYLRNRGSMEMRKIINRLFRETYDKGYAWELTKLVVEADYFLAKHHELRERENCGDMYDA